MSKGCKKCCCRCPKRLMVDRTGNNGPLADTDYSLWLTGVPSARLILGRPQNRGLTLSALQFIGDQSAESVPFPTVTMGGQVG